MPPGNCTMVIFGGSGDLARRKLVPALYMMQLEGKLPHNFVLVGVGRRKKSDQIYRQELASAVKEYSSANWNEDTWSALHRKIYYHSADVENSNSFGALKKAIKTCSIRHHTDHNYLYYLAVAPHLFEPIAANLHRNDMAFSNKGWHRIMIEKPFGHDLHSARKLNLVLTEAFHEDNIYRIDHYLGKEMLQNILVIRFANTVFEPLWNNHFIESVQISAVESDGIGDRGRYYDESGAMRDMVQSHLLQMLAVMAMEPPSGKAASLGRIEKLNLLKMVIPWPDRERADNIIFGQYNGYRQEKDISSFSSTETYAMIKLAVNNSRWQGVPFYLRTGKKLEDKVTKIVIQFKNPGSLFPALLTQNSTPKEVLSPNLLTLKIQPSEGVVFNFNIKKPATQRQIVPVNMDFCQPCAFMINTPEAYELLLADAMAGDLSRFTTWNEIESCWLLTDSIYDQHKLSGQPLFEYEPNSSGPDEARQMLARQGLQWWD